MKRFSDALQRWVVARVRGWASAEPGRRRIYAQALRVRITCPPLGVRNPLYIHAHAGLCASLRSSGRKRRSPRLPARAVEAYVVSLALISTAAVWLTVVAVLFRDK